MGVHKIRRKHCPENSPLVNPPPPVKFPPGSGLGLRLLLGSGEFDRRQFTVGELT